MTRRSGGVYESDTKPTLAFIEDTKASLYYLAREPGEVEYILQSTDFGRRLAAIKFTFRRVRDFLDLHLDFVKQYPTSIVRLSAHLAETMGPGSEQLHNHCFPNDETIWRGLPEHAHDIRSRGCRICEFRQVFSASTIRDFKIRRDRWRRMPSVQQRYPGDYDLKLTTRKSVDFGVIGQMSPSWRATVVEQRSRVADGKAEVFVVEGPLGQLNWGTFGMVKCFGASLPVHVLDPHSKPVVKGSAFRNFKLLVRALVVRRMIAKLEKAHRCTCGKSWFVCKAKDRDQRLRLAEQTLLAM